MLAAEVESWGLTRRRSRGVDTTEHRLEQATAALAAALERIAALQESRENESTARSASESELGARLRDALYELEENQAARDELSVELQSVEDLVVAERANAQQRDQALVDANARIAKLEQRSDRAAGDAPAATHAAVRDARVTELEREVAACRDELAVAESVAVDLDAAQRVMEERIASQCAEIAVLRAAAPATAPAAAAQSAVALQVASGRIQALQAELAASHEQCDVLRSEVHSLSSVMQPLPKAAEPGNAALQAHVTSLGEEKAMLEAAMGVAAARIGKLQQRLAMHTQTAAQQQEDVVELRGTVEARDKRAATLASQIAALQKDVARAHGKLRAKEAKAVAVELDAREQAKVRAQHVTLRNRAHGLQKKLDAERARAEALEAAARGAAEEHAASATAEVALRGGVVGLERQLEAAQSALEHASAASARDQDTAKAIIAQLQREATDAMEAQLASAEAVEEKQRELAEYASQQHENAAREALQRDELRRELGERQAELIESRSALEATRAAAAAAARRGGAPAPAGGGPREPEATALRVASKRIKILMGQVAELQRKRGGSSSRSPLRSPTRRPLAPRNGGY